MTVELYSFLGLCLLTMIGWIVLTHNTHALTSKRERANVKRTRVARDWDKD